MVRAQLEQFRGREVKATGEGFFASTVRDLVAGSGITFADRGRYTLKGIPDEWTILAADA